MAPGMWCLDQGKSKAAPTGELLLRLARFFLLEHRLAASGASRAQRFRSDDDDASGLQDSCDRVPKHHRRLEPLALLGRDFHPFAGPCDLKLQPMLAARIPCAED